MEATTAFTIFDKILDILGLVKQGKIKRDERMDEALSITHKALIETQAYVRDIKSDRRDHAKEEELAWRWFEASRALRYVDEELAVICHIKGGYWSNLDAWEDTKADGYDIALENVEAKTRVLLQNK